MDDGKFAGAFTEDMEGEDLARFIVDYWHVGAGSTMFVDELFHACDKLNVSANTISDVISAVNDYRHHDISDDVLNHAFLPQENIQAARDLLDQLQGLCVKW